ncbi:hypothetical protein [Oricola sp.]|uniref:hypothetical protein n=1 Tax=Oricola sp. TaxID=1979950 RepID=UPI0025E0C2F7|nr:hypothetical protein [Oricola sp.]MCI5078740.1 hypothetical protein [Oricola sp.]
MSEINAVWRPPFGLGATEIRTFPAGARLAEIADAMSVPEGFHGRGVVTVSSPGHCGAAVSDEIDWRCLRIHGGCTVVFQDGLRDGGGGGSSRGKNVLATVLSVGALLAATAISGGVLGGVFKAGSLAARLLGGAVAVAGQLAAAGISATPVQDESDQESPVGAASLSGNALERGGYIPRVMGGRRIFPKLACEPLIERDGQNEFVEGVYVAEGPHDLSEIRIGDSDVASAEDVQVETREGWAADTPISLVQRYGKTRTPNIELSQHAIDPDNTNLLEDQVVPENSLPVWHGTAVSKGADELWLHFSCPSGLQDQQNTDRQQTLGFRVRLIASDGTIYNLPEVWFGAETSRDPRPTIEIKWADAPETTPAPPSENGWLAALTSVQNSAWEADESFYAGSGNTYLVSGSVAASGVERVRLTDKKCEFFLDETAIPNDYYRVEVKRSATLQLSVWDFADYATSDVGDQYGYETAGSSYQPPRDTKSISDRCYLLRAASVWNTHPVAGGAQGPGVAIIAVRGKNRSIADLSVFASGYVQDWDGSGWNDWVVTSNPAPHYRSLFRSDWAADPLPEDAIDDVSLVAWRADCIARTLTSDLVVESQGLIDAANQIAGAGYARFRASDKWGVVRDYNRSNEDPVQIFGSRNMNNLTMDKALPRLPDGFRVSWGNPTGEEDDPETIVYRTGREGVSNPRLEAVSYPAIVLEARAVERARFDLAQLEMRSAFYTFDAPPEAIVCERGDLIGINHWIFEEYAGSARVEAVDVSGGMIQGVWLDQTIPVVKEPLINDVADLTTIEDMTLLGLTTAVMIRNADGTMTTHVVANDTGDADYLAFETPIAVDTDADVGDLIQEDCLVVGGARAAVTRHVVQGMKPDSDMFFSVTAVDEAPGLPYPPRALTLEAGVGSYAMTGQDVGFSRSLALVAEAGGFVVGGQDAELVATQLLTAEYGAFTLSGQDADLFPGYSVVAETGSFALSGQDAGLNAAYLLEAEAGSLALSGQDVAFSSSLSLDLVGSSTGTNSCTMPTVESGDVAIWIGAVYFSSTNKVAVYPDAPSGFTSLDTDVFLPGNRIGWRVAYRILDGTEDGSSIPTSDEGDQGRSGAVVVYRPSVGVTTVALAGEHVVDPEGGDPAAQAILGTDPSTDLAIAFCAFFGAPSGVTSASSSPALAQQTDPFGANSMCEVHSDGYVAADFEDVTFDCGDGGAVNGMICTWIELS